MASPSSPEIIVPIGSQKHDPAWKHCLMIRKGDKTHLKCLYCVKIFSGGGIHRIKEHLACQKGNASSCSKVPDNVRLAMLQSLEGVVVRKKKKQKLAEEVKQLNNVVNQFDTFATQVELDKSMVGAPLPIDAIEEKKEVITAVKKKKRGRVPPSPHHVVAQCDAGVGSVRPKDHVHMAIGRFLFEAGVPFDSMNSIYLQPMIDAIIAAGPGLVPPSYHDTRGWILENSLDEVKTTLEQWKMTWVRTGCSILAEEWTSGTDRTFINFLVYCPEGTLFLKSVDATQIVTSADALYELLSHLVEEVGVRNVVQVITKNSEIHAIAGKRLTEAFPTMFWTPCSAGCIEAMLDDFGRLEQIAVVLDQAKSVTGFIYNHAMVLNMMRKYTGGKELLRPTLSSSATNFLTLKTMASLKDNLQAMVTSQEWMDCIYSRDSTGSMMTSLLCNPSFWSACSTITRITNPLVRALRIGHSNSRLSMGHMYVSMYSAKESIQRELKEKNYYMPYWNIIDWRWKRELSRPLHMAGFFLNPQFFYKLQGDIPEKIMSGMLDCIERLVPDLNVQDKINRELSLYKSAAGDFGRKMAVRARTTLSPAEWWSTYGGGCPNLARLAIRILSQACSARGCERGGIPFEQIHSPQMNSLERQRLIDLVFIQYNLRLQQQKFSKKKYSDPISVDNIKYVGEWVVEKSELFSREDESSWTAIAQPLANGVLSEYPNDDEEDPFAIGFHDVGILSVAHEEQDIDGIKEEDSCIISIKEGNSNPCSHSLW